MFVTFSLICPIFLIFASCFYYIYFIFNHFAVLFMIASLFHCFYFLFLFSCFAFFFIIFTLISFALLVYSFASLTYLFALLLYCFTHLHCFLIDFLDFPIPFIGYIFVMFLRSFSIDLRHLFVLLLISLLHLLT